MALYFAPQPKETKRTKINPAQYVSRQEQKVQKTAGSKQQQKVKTSKNISKKTKKPQKDKAENQDQKNIKPNKTENKTQQTQNKLPVIKDNKALQLPEKSDELMSALATLPEAVQAQPQLSPQEAMLNDVYGDDVTKLSTTAKKYLMDNHLKMQIITQRVLNRIGRVYIDPRFHYYDHNYIEFTLFPDGHISNIKILKDAGFKLLDKITKETIETAYKDYPRPKEPTLVRYKFLYDLRTY